MDIAGQTAERRDAEAKHSEESERMHRVFPE
jgi:hypothetical protein